MYVCMYMLIKKLSNEEIDVMLQDPMTFCHMHALHSAWNAAHTVFTYCI